MKSKYVIRKRAMGDVLWIEPVIRKLAFQYKRLTVITKFNELFYNFPYTNVIFKSDLNFFEKIISRVEYFFNTKILFINLDNAYEQDCENHFLHAYQRKAGLPETNEYPKIYLSEIEKIIPFFKSDRYVILHIESFSTKNYRQVYGIDWNEIVRYLKEKGYEVVLVGKNIEKIDGAISFKTSIREMINLIYHAEFFIGLDSGPSHLAVCLKKAALIFFGAVNPLYRHFPELFDGFFLQQPCEFANCYHKKNDKKEPSCKLVGDDGIPKCSVHSNEYVKGKIDLLLKKYVEKND